MPEELKPSVLFRAADPLPDDYREAAQELLDAANQIEKREWGCGCAICADSDHDARACHHNVLIAARRWAAATCIYVCWHCGFTATSEEEATAHFGKREEEWPVCYGILRPSAENLPAPTSEATMTKELKPCPNKKCPSPSDGHGSKRSKYGFRTSCLTCGVAGPWADTQEAADEGWNRIARPSVEAAESRDSHAIAFLVRCKKCKAATDMERCEIDAIDKWNGQTMTDLIARLKAAEVGSRELSDEVLLALGWVKFYFSVIHASSGSVTEHWTAPNGSMMYASERPSPTESVDDALALAPPDKAYCISFQPPNHYEVMVEVPEYSISSDPNDPKGRFVLGRAATPALALCAAILRAKEARG